MSEVEFLRSFRRNPDGSWSAVKRVKIGAVILDPGHSFTRHVTFDSVDIAERLDKLAAKYPQDVKTQ